MKTMPGGASSYSRMAALKSKKANKGKMMKAKSGKMMKANKGMMAKSK